ncbi:hypothetical protein AKO1_008626 [Acrasis kona]|uniref:Uncharacterized protein n=1 Tax=Acrasis kona TaxID=1008807 RepID=A0AAW2YNJ7_9EUKA
MKQVRRVVKENIQSENVPVEVKAFETFVSENGGLTGGWDERDHAQFLRLRAKLKPKDENMFISTAAREIPDQTILTIQEHEKWYKLLLQMMEYKKMAVKKWRQDKERSRIEAVIHEQETHIEKIQMDEDKQRRIDQKRRNQEKQRLDSWRQYKARVNEAEEEKKREEEAEKKQRQEQEEKRRKQISIQQLEEYQRYKESKQIQEKQELVRELSRTPRPASPRDLQRVRQREEEYLLRQQELKSKKQRQSQERQDRIDRMASQVRVEVDRDFDRLTQPTQSYKNRISEQSTDGDNGGGTRMNNNFDVRHLQHLSKPSWRKGL